MKRIAFAAFLMFLFSVTSFGQTADEEASRIREQLGVDSSTPIALATTSTLPQANPLKVYLAFGLAMDIRDRMLERITDWNKKQGEKYGLIEVASDVRSADVILVHYSLRDNAQNVTHTTVGSGTVYDPKTGGMITRPVSRTQTVTYIPGYSYIVRPTSNGFEIIWRYLGRSIEHDRRLPGQTMRDHFFDLLKARSKTTK